MSRELFKQYVEEFRETILEIGRLPRIGEKKFKNGEDQRKWYNSISSLENFSSTKKEIDDLLTNLHMYILTDDLKRKEFLETCHIIKRIPLINEFYFSDNTDMHKWYLNYIVNNNSFVDEVITDLPEYLELDLAVVWTPECKKEFEYILKSKGRILNYNEKKLSNGIDFRVIYTKLITFDRKYAEQVKLFVANNKQDHLNNKKRKEELLGKIRKFKYIPILGECQFSDGTDMNTWYIRYQKQLDEEINEILSEFKIKRLVVYAIPKFNNNGGKFYTVCSNDGMLLDTSELETFEELKEKDPTIEKIGGIVLKKDKKLSSNNRGKK